VIQQQVFGPAPNEYRALAAAIGVDVARVQAGFDELDRLARLEMRALDLEDGVSDLHAVCEELIRRLNGALRSRSAAMHLSASGEPVAVPLATPELQQLCWRILATAAAAIAPGEELEAILRHHGDSTTLLVQLPAALEQREDLFASTEILPSRVLSAGMFGTGFTLRLARAEAQAAGGSLSHDEERMVLTLPLAGAETRALHERAGN
jgi:two-component system, OmpR family, sensor kinase